MPATDRPQDRAAEPVDLSEIAATMRAILRLLRCYRWSAMWLGCVTTGILVVLLVSWLFPHWQISSCR